MKYTLLLVLLLLLLGSCGSSTDGPGTEATAGPRISLSYWEYWDPSLDDLLDEIFFEFAEESGIHLERNHYEPTQLRDGFIQEAVIGGGPDFIILPSDHLGSISLSRSALPADEAFPAEFFQAFSSQSLEHVTLDGKVWGVPILTGNSLILFYNRTLVPTPPANWDELILMAREQTTENTWGLTYNLSSPFYFAPFLAAFGGSFFEPGTANPSLDSPAMAQALEFVHDLKFRHEILSPMTDSPSANRFFAEGRAAFLINGPWAINQFVDAVDFALMPLPPIGDRIPRPLIASGTLVLNQNLQGQPEKLEAVEEVIRFLTNVETQVQMALIAREIPAINQALNDPRLTQDPLLSQFIQQIAQGVPLSSIPEMRLVFQATRTGVEEVVFGNSDFTTVAETMQREALEAIADL